MPRKSYIPKREVMCDPKFDDVVITELVNNVMLNGKKGTAQRVVYEALENIEEATNEEALEVLYKALNSVMSVSEVKGRRISGTTYQAPMEVRLERHQTLGLRWPAPFTRERGEKTMAECLAEEISDVSNGLGASVKRKEEIHRTAETDKTLAHCKW